MRVNAVAPSIAMHPFLAKVTTDELLDELTSREAFGRAAEPWEVANVIVFLASGLLVVHDRRDRQRQQPACLSAPDRLSARQSVAGSCRCRRRRGRRDSKPVAEPLDPLLATSRASRSRGSLDAGLLLDAVVADGGGGLEASSRSPSSRSPSSNTRGPTRRRSSRPAARCAPTARSTTAGRRRYAEQVLHVVADLVGDHVGLGEVAGGAEAVAAARGRSRGRCTPADRPGSRRARPPTVACPQPVSTRVGEQHELRRLVGRALGGEELGPRRLQVVHDRPHEVLELVVGRAAGALSISGPRRRPAGASELAEDVVEAGDAAAAAAAAEQRRAAGRR